jgi:branched-chain amino acid transport system permease protein
MTVFGARPRLSLSFPTLGRAAAWAAGLIVLWAVAARTLHRGVPPGIVLRGVVFGSLYALTAIGIVLIYRANRVINFAQAEFGSVAAVVAIEFTAHGLPYGVAIPLGLLIAAAVGAIVELTIVRRFRKAPRLILAVATIGIAQVLAAISLIIPLVWEGPAAHAFNTPFDVRFFVAPEIFNGNHLVVLVAVPALLLAIAGFLRFTDYGIGIRAAAENADRAHLLGIPVPRLSTIVWITAGVLSALAAIMRVPLVGFASFASVSGAGNSLLLRTLAAAVIGRMENLPRVAAAAVAIGVFENVAVWNLPRTTVVDAMLVLVILVALLTQRGFFTRSAETGISSWKAIREVRPVPTELRHLPEVKWVFRGLGLALLALAALLPLRANPSQDEAAALVLIYAIVAISLLVLTGWAGHISLGQFALVGFGGATTALLYGRHGWDIFPAMLAGTVVAALVALVIGLPALRIRGPFLAVTTLAFAVTSATYFLAGRYFPWFIESHIDRPALLGRLPLQQEWQMYLLCLAGLVVVILGVRGLRRSFTGRALIAVRDNETAAEAATLPSTRLKLVAFVISGAIAGFAGALYVLHQRGLNTDSFNADVSIRLFSMVVIGGLGSLPGAVLGAVYVRGVEFFLPPAYALLASGAGILLLLLFLPEGLGGLVYAVRDAYLRRVARRRQLLVPSLVADRRIEEAEEARAQVAIGTALGGFQRAAGGARAARELVGAGEAT